MKSDIQIKKDVTDQLKWDEILIDCEIRVAVKNGIVTLSGEVDSYAKKIAAENATKKIAGVKAIAEEIEIGVSSLHNKTDSEIAEDIVTALKWNSSVREEIIKIKIENGNVRLEGEVEWEFERASAQTAIENLVGVRSITNLVTIKQMVSSAGIGEKISAAFHRSATIDAGKITVDVTGCRVTLRGKVRSLAEKEDAEKAAWAAPGVLSVDSTLEITLPDYAVEEYKPGFN
jgi:osmotically-inducible protein OsmY